MEGVHAIGVLRVVELLFRHQLTVCQVSEAGFDDHVVFKVQDALKIAQRHVQHQADAGWQRLEEPDVRHWSGQFDVAHTLATDLLQRDFHAAFLADNAAIFHTLIFTAEAFVIFDRAKDTCAEKAVTLWLERAVVDGFWLLDLAKGPREDPFW